MRAVIQRVAEAQVTVDQKVVGAIKKGLLVLVGIENEDGDIDIDWLAKKIINLRIFNDSQGLMNQSLQEVDGALLVISQFTLHAKTKKGNRPSYVHAARPEVAIPLYEKFIHKLEVLTSEKVETGIFGAHMEVNLTNDGPVTIVIDTKNKE